MLCILLFKRLIFKCKLISTRVKESVQEAKHSELNVHHVSLDDSLYLEVFAEFNCSFIKSY